MSQIYSSPCEDDTLSLSHSSSIAHQLILPLRKNRELDNTMRKFLIRMVNIKCYPNKKRVIVEIENWEETIPKRIKIDSQNRHCNACGNKDARYIVNETSWLYAWRLCAKCLSPRDREVLEEYYWCYKKI